MKKVVLLCLVAIAFISCSSGPEKTAKNFLENLSKGKVEEAKKYATEPTGNLLDLATGFGSLPVDPDFKFKLVKDSIVGNKAWITYSDQNDKVETIELAKIDGDWKVHMQSNK